MVKTYEELLLENKELKRVQLIHIDKVKSYKAFIKSIKLGKVYACYCIYGNIVGDKTKII